MDLISIITVNYKQPEVTCELLESIRKSDDSGYEVIVVDNGSGDNSEEIIKSSHPEVIYVSSEKNLGFAGGNNLGMQHACGEYFLFINNDTEIFPGFLSAMRDTFQKYPDASVVSPKIIFAEEANLIQYAGAKSINLNTGRGKKIGNKEKDIGQYDFVGATELGHGAALMVKRKVVEQVGGMPELYFLYYEEHDWCELIKRNGFKLYYNGLTKILHKESVSVGKANPLKVFYMNRNRLIYCKRNSRNMAQRIVSLVFYLSISFPKAFIKYLLKGEIKFVSALLKGVFNGLFFVNYNKSYPIRFLKPEQVSL